MIFVYNFADRRATQNTLGPFECFLSSCMKKNEKIVIVFTRHDTILKEWNQCKGKGDEAKCYQWLIQRYPTVSNAVHQNDIRCMFIENVGEWELREKYRQKLFNMCGIQEV